jgi:hypothetical protein
MAVYVYVTVEFGIFFDTRFFNKNKTKHNNNRTLCVRLSIFFPLLNKFTDFYEIAMKIVQMASTSTHTTECDR